MNIVQQLNQFNIQDILFSEPIKNTVIDNSRFIRIFTSDENIIINGIYLYISLYTNVYENKKEYKKKYTFDLEKNILCINLLKSIEKQLLVKVSNINKEKHLRLSKQLEDGYIKIFSRNDRNDRNDPNQSCNKSFILLKQNNIYSSIIDSTLNQNTRSNTDRKNTSNNFITVSEKNSIHVTENVLSKFIVKISGIWENDISFGITYKFIPIEN